MLSILLVKIFNFDDGNEVKTLKTLHTRMIPSLQDRMQLWSGAELGLLGVSQGDRVIRRLSVYARVPRREDNSPHCSIIILLPGSPPWPSDSGSSLQSGVLQQ